MLLLQAYAELYIVETFIEKVMNLEDRCLQPILTKLCQLYAIYLITRSAGDYIVVRKLGLPS